MSELARGNDRRGVVPDEEAKSYSHEETFARDVSDADFLEGVLLDQSVRVSRRLRGDAVAGRIVQLKLRYHDFRTLTRRTTLPVPTADPDRICAAARTLFRANWNGEPVRLIGAGVSGVVPEGRENLDLFHPPEREGRKRRLAEAIDHVEERFGRGKVTRARLVVREPGGVEPSGRGPAGSEPGGHGPTQSEAGRREAEKREAGGREPEKHRDTEGEPLPGKSGERKWVEHENAGRELSERESKTGGSGSSRPRLISEAIVPLAGSFDPAAMSRGEPGLPGGFSWRGKDLRIIACDRVWKKLGPEPSGELYLRRHYFQIRMEDGACWTVYCLRQPAASGAAKRRWFLYSID